MKLHFFTFLPTVPTIVTGNISILIIHDTEVAGSQYKGDLQDTSCVLLCPSQLSEV